ncbi:MaoC family dehydratase [Nocardia sp. NPDC050799]|uniref:MaoC family dehydratase n=1 Tax=Nocardia sp. NPDC050799 TaxID=3154842 RepID=UPI0033CD6C93
MSGFAGRYFEDFEAGKRIDHGIARTVTEQDNQSFTLLTYNTNMTHTNHEFASHTEFGRPLMNSTFTLALVSGLTVRDISENAVANLGWGEIEILNPVFAGDTIFASTWVLETRESKSRPGAGIIKVRTLAYKGDREPVMRFVRSVMIHKRGQGPRAHWPMPPALKGADAL